MVLFEDEMHYLKYDLSQSHGNVYYDGEDGN